MGRGGGRRLALVRNRTLVEYRVEDPETSSRIGEIHLGRVLRVDKGIDAAFVEIGLDRPALLPLAEHKGRLAEGDAVVVQVTRDARDGKGARLTGRPVLPGLYLVLDPSRPTMTVSSRIADPAAADRIRVRLAALHGPAEGFIIRQAVVGADPESIVAEAERLRAAWREIMAACAGRRPPVLLHRDADPVVSFLRDAGGRVDEIVADSRGVAEALQRRLAAALPDLAGRVVFRPARDWRPSADEIEEQVEAALDPEVALPGGGFLLFEPGRTLTAVDVNSGTAALDGAGRRGGERLILEANLAAVPEIARQLRLRNLGGIVVIDFIDMKAVPARRRVVEAMRAALADDPAPTQVGTMSRFGLVELTRRRRGASLAEMLSRPCPTCGGSGRVRADSGAPPGGVA